MRIDREAYVERLKAAEGNGLIKIITGIRRCGKSFLLFELFCGYLRGRGVDADHIIGIALDDRSSKALRDPDRMLAYVKDKIRDEQRYYILIDELQMLKEYEDVLNSFLHLPNAEVYAAVCSLSYLTPGLLSRSDEIRVYPFHFAEYMSVFEGSVYQGWDSYIMYGGLPVLLAGMGPESAAAPAENAAEGAAMRNPSVQEREELLLTLMNRVYLPDIAARYAVRSRNELEDLVNMLVTSLGTLVNPLRFSELFRTSLGKKVSDKTIKKFLDYFEEAFLVKKAARYEIRSRKYITSASKYFFADIGLRNARLRFQGLEEGCIVENIIHNELCARGFRVDTGLVEAYEKDASKKFVLRKLDVDFVASRGSMRCYIQSAYGLTDAARLEEKRRALAHIEDSFPKVVLVKDDIGPRRDENGIFTVGVFYFLLNTMHIVEKGDLFSL